MIKRKMVYFVQTSSIAVMLKLSPVLPLPSVRKQGKRETNHTLRVLSLGNLWARATLSEVG